MRRLAAVLGALLAAAGCRGEDLERWQYERILYEREPEIGSRDDARGRFEGLSRRPELTLDDCYRMALYRSETLAISGEDLVRIQSAYDQAVGAALPGLSFRGNLSRQDATGVVSSSNVQSSFTARQRAEYRFTAHQTLFSGLAEFYALRQQNALFAAKEDDLRHLRLLLYADVADAFYAVLQLERDLATTQDSLQLARERLEELVQRNRAGISRRSEVLAQEAEAASIQAALERLKGAHAVAWEALIFVTGMGSPKKLADTAAEPGEIPPVESYLARARTGRRDLQALRKQVGAAEETIGIARAGYLPTADFDANYYTHREGISSEIDWDVVLSFTVPIFEGGVARAKIREARSFVRAAELEVERLRRDIILQVNRSYAEVKSLQSELVSLEKAVVSAQENYEIVQAEYRRSIVTNIEVLASFNTLQRARLERDRARFQLKVAGVRLEVSSGSLPGDGR